MSPDVTDTVAAIRFHYRWHLFAQRERIGPRNAIGGRLRRELGWTNPGQLAPGQTKAEVERANRIAVRHTQALLKFGDALAAGKADGDEPDGFELYAGAIMASRAACKPWEDEEAKHVRLMRKAARELPVWKAWAEGVLGLSDKGLATIVGEAGDLSCYPKKGHLWKRMGVAVMGAGDGVNDHRQGNPGPGASAQDWIKEAYKKFRRARLYAAIAEPMIKNRGTVYREIYDRRRQYEIDRFEREGSVVLEAGKKAPAGSNARYIPAMWVHRRSHRYMEKLLLRDLLQAWRAVGQRGIAERPISECQPPADHHEPLTANLDVPKAAKRPLPDAARETYGDMHV